MCWVVVVLRGACRGKVLGGGGVGVKCLVVVVPPGACGGKVLGGVGVCGGIVLGMVVFVGV